MKHRKQKPHRRVSKKGRRFKAGRGSVKITDPRNKRSKLQDIHKRAKIILKPTPKNIRYWKKHRNRVDLIGVDVLNKRVRRIRATYKSRRKKPSLKILPTSNRTQIKDKRKFYSLKRRTGLTGVEEHQLVSIVAKAVGEENIDKVDINSLVDDSLSYDENKEILERAVNPSMRDFGFYDSMRGY